MKKFGFGLAALVMASACLNTATAQTTRITIGTAGTAGALYPMGVAMAETINRHADGIRASAEATGGSVENMRLMAGGDMEWGISANELAYMAYQGEGAYEGHRIESLRSLFGTVKSWVQIFAAADSDLESVADFEGKRIGVGPAGSGGEQSAQMLLAHHGLSYDDVREEFMTNADMIASLQDGQLDAFVITHPLRSAPLIDLTTSFDVKMIPVADDEFYAEYPFYEKSEVPPGSYGSVKDAVYTPTSRIVMYTSTNAGLSDDQVYAMIKAVWDNADEWQDVHAAVTNSTTLEAALNGLDGVPLHAGARRYYEEQGMEIPESLRE
ncbi:MAG: TAXI family TRAP transporter solute-binding subunit [Aquisalimonadaceae bacterium]